MTGVQTCALPIFLQSYDTYSVATNVNMTFINGTLPVMAAAALVIQIRDLLGIIRRPASSFGRKD